MTSKEKLVELLHQANYGAYNHTLENTHTDRAIEEIADYLLENEVVVLPCKVGETVYLFDKYSKSPIVKGCVDEILIDSSSRGIWIIVTKDEYNRRIAFFEDEISDTIFFSEEEIKAKIKGV